VPDHRQISRDVASYPEDPGMPRFFTVFSFLTLVTSTLFGQVEGPKADPDSPGQQAPTTIELTIDFGDGFQKRYTQLAYQPNMTVLGALIAARQHPHKTEFKFRGEGATAFVTSVDRISNRGADGPNWVFLVNDKMARQSCGITELKPGDAVLWRFKGIE
jgi:hypothetical protein